MEIPVIVAILVVLFASLKIVQEYERGKPKAKVKKIGTSKLTGTKVIYIPDQEIFQIIEWNEKKT